MNTTSNFSQKRALAALLTGISAVILILYRVVFPLPPVHRNYADGTYINAECGKITFRDGTVVIAATSTTYTLEQQKNGIAGLASHFLGVENDSAGCRVVYDQSKYSTYLKFGGDKSPQSVELPSLDGRAPYIFKRE